MIRSRRIGNLRRTFLLLALLWICSLLGTVATTTHAWEWNDVLGNLSGAADADDNDDSSSSTLSMQQISELRVRDIKRRLARHHGYSAEELARILDKKELIQSLAFEEHKLLLNKEAKLKRKVVKRGILTSVIAIVVVVCWPLIHQGYEVAAVNFVVYTDRKKLEARRCWELHSAAGFLGIAIMFVIDLLSAWLTLSIVLSWVMRSKYFFPVPNLSIRPAQMMGGQMAQSSLSNYGLNVGPMAISWLMRFVYGRVEGWTGRALLRAQREQRKAAREFESQEDKAARKAARKQAKLEAKARQQQEAARRTQQQQPASTMPPDWMQAVGGAQQASTSAPFLEESSTGEGVWGPGPLSGSSSIEHQEFLEQLEQHNSGLDDLD